MDYRRYIGKCEDCPHREDRASFSWCSIHSLEVYNPKNAGCRHHALSKPKPELRLLKYKAA